MCGHAVQSMDPIELHLQSDVKRVIHFRWSIDEVKYTECHVIDPIVFGTVEMVPNVFLHVPSIYHPEVGLEPIHQCSLGLTNILGPAHFAGNTVYQVGAFASHILFGNVPLPSMATLNVSTVIQSRTIPAVLGLALVDGLAAGLLSCFKNTRGFLELCSDQEIS